jgi:hypothetical protein
MKINVIYQDWPQQITVRRGIPEDVRLEAEIQSAMRLLLSAPNVSEYLKAQIRMEKTMQALDGFTQSHSEDLGWGREDFMHEHPVDEDLGDDL